MPPPRARLWKPQRHGHRLTPRSSREGAHRVRWRRRACARTGKRRLAVSGQIRGVRPTGRQRDACVACAQGTVRRKPRGIARGAATAIGRRRDGTDATASHRSRARRVVAAAAAVRERRTATDAASSRRRGGAGAATFGRVRSTTSDSAGRRFAMSRRGAAGANHREQRPTDDLRCRVSRCQMAYQSLSRKSHEFTIISFRGEEPLKLNNECVRKLCHRKGLSCRPFFAYRALKIGRTVPYLNIANVKLRCYGIKTTQHTHTHTLTLTLMMYLTSMHSRLTHCRPNKQDTARGPVHSAQHKSRRRLRPGSKTPPGRPAKAGLAALPTAGRRDNWRTARLQNLCSAAELALLGATSAAAAASSAAAATVALRSAVSLWEISV